LKKCSSKKNQVHTQTFFPFLELHLFVLLTSSLMVEEEERMERKRKEREGETADLKEEGVKTMFRRWKKRKSIVFHSKRREARRRG
jgi:hypothetical protein